MANRRQFLKLTAAGASFLTIQKVIAKNRWLPGEKDASPSIKPVVISTWKFGVPANREAWKILQEGGTALDAVETGVRVPEGDPLVSSVGYGGLPDRDGHVTLDACIMDHKGNCGSVAFLQHIKHPISVARKVMEKTRHIMLVGDGALRFALEEGFPSENLLTPEAEAKWKAWQIKEKYQPDFHQDDHDTIGMIALDKEGNLSGACTTSGLAYKMHGRVGDSPIIGAALYVDNEVGAATATGVGEEVIRIVGAHTIVELMRQGATPEEACKLALERIIKLRGDLIKSFQLGFLALNKQGEWGAYGLNKDFEFALSTPDHEHLLQTAKSIY